MGTDGSPRTMQAYMSRFTGKEMRQTLTIVDHASGVLKAVRLACLLLGLLVLAGTPSNP